MRLAIFDVDGTLVDSRGMITAALTAALTSEQIAIPGQRELMSIVGLSLVDAMRKLVPGGGAALHERLASTYKQAFWQFRASGQHTEDLFAGAREVLEALRLRGDVLLGIATGKSRRGVEHLIEFHGFQGWFATVQTADDHPSKPHPSMVATALAETAVGRENAVMIGDTSFDMAMARAGGIQALGVTWGNHQPDELAGAGAHVIINDIKQLLPALDSLWQERAA